MSVAELTAEIAHPTSALLGEGPVWDETTSTLLFVDIESDAVHRYDPSSGALTSFATGSAVGAVVLRQDGGLVLALVDHFAFGDASGENIEAVPGFVTNAAEVRFNDGKVDPWGRFVAGTMHWGHVDPIGSLYRLSPGGQVEELLSAVTISNGLAWTEDRRSMYYIDTPTSGVDVFDVDPDDGSMTGRRRLATLDADIHGHPDGMALDTEGCLWVACYWGSRVCRFTPDGVLDTIVHVPTRCVTSVAFAGSNLDTMYITSAKTDLSEKERGEDHHAGHLFVVDPGVSGLVSNRFG